MSRPNILESILKRRIETEVGCWEWTGGLDTAGYGSVSYQGRLWGVHRLVYLLLIGPIPEATLDHLCRNRKCFNPDHLEPVSCKVNALRGIGPTAINSIKTHCYRGHSLTGDNLKVRGNGARVCRECRREGKRKYYAKKVGRPIRAYKYRSYK